MARDVDHLEGAVAKIDGVAFLEHAGRRRRFERVCARIEARARVGVEQLLGIEHVAGILERLLAFLAEIRRAQLHAAVGVGEVLRLGGVDQALFELVHAAGVIEMVVGRAGQQRLVDQIARRLLEARQAERGVDQQVAVAAAHMPDVAADQRVDVRFVDQRDVVVDPLAMKPLLGNLHRRRAPGWWPRHAKAFCGHLYA